MRVLDRQSVRLDIEDMGLAPIFSNTTWGC